MGEFELAQVDVATPSAPLTSPELAWFTDALEAVDAVADAAPGFCWRLQSDEGDATGLRERGPTPNAFTFRQPFAATDDDAGTVESHAGWFCRA